MRDLPRRRRLKSTMTKLLTTIATTAVLGVAATAGAAEAPVVSDQQWIAGHAPVTIPGTGVRKGEWMGAKAKLVYRDVTLEAGQKARVTLRADGTRRVRGLAVAKLGKLRFVALDTRYPGRRQVTVRAWVAARTHGEVTTRIYALTR
jgi:hypothetical protein